MHFRGRLQWEHLVIEKWEQLITTFELQLMQIND
jgi:hypothetical protein